MRCCAQHAAITTGDCLGFRFATLCESKVPELLDGKIVAIVIVDCAPSLQRAFRIHGMAEVLIRKLECCK